VKGLTNVFLFYSSEKANTMLCISVSWKSWGRKSEPAWVNVTFHIRKERQRYRPTTRKHGKNSLRFVVR